jgi:alcohol dehydrogenase class IV
VELMSEQALASGSPANNPRVPTAAEIVAIYGTVYR